MSFEEISEILKQYHSNPMGGHSGINNTLAKISQYYLWNGMKEVNEYVSGFQNSVHVEYGIFNGAYLNAEL